MLQTREGKFCVELAQRNHHPTVNEGDTVDITGRRFCRQRPYLRGIRADQIRVVSRSELVEIMAGQDLIFNF